MRILVAMSGGVDSSVAAHLLAREGHELIGVMMRLWSDPLAPATACGSRCCSAEHIERARAVSNDLRIPFYLLNLERAFKRNIVDPFIADYERGVTPNPCVVCNRELKFGVLLAKAEELGCGVLASGHYARIRAEQPARGGTRIYRLLEGTDKKKDQSYFLYHLSQEKLARIVLPLGAMRKADVYALAKEFGIRVPETYRETQNLCFFPEREPAAFLERHCTRTSLGPVKRADGTVIGTHRGLPFYTIGQRKRLGIGGLSTPLHVIRKEYKSNTIFVAPSGDDYESELSVCTLSWIRGFPPAPREFESDARISSQGVKHRGTLTFSGASGRFRFSERLRGIAPGQSIVFYKDEEVLGGGVIFERNSE